MADKFQLLKARCAEELKAAEARVQELQQKMHTIQQLEAESEALNGTVQASGRYREMGLTDAIVDAIGTLGAGGGATASSVASHLLANGFESSGENFRNSVSTTLARLANVQKRIRSELRDGARLYMP
jgi:hypothetical protein